MDRGRPVKGPGLVERLEGTEGAKKRLRVILETIAGEKSVEEACRELGIGKSAFHQIRAKVMQAALQDLEPRQAGRPAAEPSESEEKIASLEKELDEAQLALQVAHVREELLLGMPEMMKPLLEKKKRMEARKKRRRELKKQRQEKRRRR
jgi:flagellar motility protein MotE (MotC chaperone)